MPIEPRRWDDPPHTHVNESSLPLSFTIPDDYSGQGITFQLPKSCAGWTVRFHPPTPLPFKASYKRECSHGGRIELAMENECLACPCCGFVPVRRIGRGEIQGLKMMTQSERDEAAEAYEKRRLASIAKAFTDELVRKSRLRICASGGGVMP